MISPTLLFVRFDDGITAKVETRDVCRILPTTTSPPPGVATPTLATPTPTFSSAMAPPALSLGMTTLHSADIGTNFGVLFFVFLFKRTIINVIIYDYDFSYFIKIEFRRTLSPVLLAPFHKYLRSQLQALLAFELASI